MVDGVSTDVDPARIDALIEEGDLSGARSELSEVAERDPRFAVVRIKLGLRDGTLAPASAMAQLIQLMRQDEDTPGAKALYHEASERAYRSRESSVAHSHPPPPTTRTPRS